MERRIAGRISQPCLAGITILISRQIYHRTVSVSAMEISHPSIRIISGVKRSLFNACHYMFLHDRKVKLHRRTVLTGGRTDRRILLALTRNEIIVPNGNVSGSNFLSSPPSACRRAGAHFSSRQEIRIFTMMKYVSVEIMLRWLS